jgi:hypothetical protein
MFCRFQFPAHRLFLVLVAVRMRIQFNEFFRMAVKKQTLSVKNLKSGRPVTGNLSGK